MNELLWRLIMPIMAGTIAALAQVIRKKNTVIAEQAQEITELREEAEVIRVWKNNAGRMEAKHLAEKEELRGEIEMLKELTKAAEEETRRYREEKFENDRKHRAELKKLEETKDRMRETFFEIMIQPMMEGLERRRKAESKADIMTSEPRTEEETKDET